MDAIQTNYLEQLDRAPDQEKFPLVRRWMDTEPLPFFAELRARRPILQTPVCTLLARYDDVVEVLGMPKTFTVALYIPKMQNGLYLMAHDDDALHTREKSIMQGMLNRDDLPAVRDLVAKSAKAILDKAGGRIEVVNDYCRMVPATLVQDYFGLNGVDSKDLIRWSYWNQYDTFHNQPFDLRSDADRKRITDLHNQTGEELGRYIGELVAKQLIMVKAGNALGSILGCWYFVKLLWRKLLGTAGGDIGDTILTRMLKTSYPDQVDFDIARLAINASGLLIGAIETTSQAVAQAIQYLLNSPDWLARAKAAAQLPDTSVLDGMVWEALRFVPISPYLFRQAATDYTLARGTAFETKVQAGSYVLPLTQSAMFDPQIFEQPEQFIPTRNWYHYFHFGFGSHECLGKYVGMVMIPEMIRHILLLPNLRDEGAIDYKSGPFPEEYWLSWE